MSHKSLVVWTATAVLMLGVTAWAQTEETEESFSLQRESSTAAAELELADEESFQRWVPAIKQGTVEVSFALGFMNFGTRLWQHDQIIYKFEQEYTYFGDVEIQGESAFSPTMRIGGNISRWFALEAVGAMSFSEYQASITNTKRQKNEAGSPVEFDPPLGEFDAEQRSLFTGSAGANILIYPLNIAKETRSHFHPYITLGGARMWYDMNSNYTNSVPTSSWDLNGGAGLRILADRNISVRFEIQFHSHDLKWDAPEFFTTRDEDTVKVPLEDWPEGKARREVEEYSSQKMSVIGWSIGVQGSF